VILERTRADVCHIGFIEGGCLIALLIPFALSPRRRVFSKLAVGLKVMIGVSAAAALMAAGAFHAYAISILPADGQDLDEIGRLDTGAAMVSLRVPPGQTLFVTPYGGWHYLYSQRENGTSYAFIIDDPLSAAHWPVAASQIVARRPLLLFISDRELDILAHHQPRIRQLYFGYSGNYMLNDRGEAPPFPVGARWNLEHLDDRGASRSSLAFEVIEGAGARVVVAIQPARSEVLMGAIHGDRFSIFRGGMTYVGRVSPDGQRIDGKVFGVGPTPWDFTAARQPNP
jgi:hypothetical protein